jgi:hypothetical protein
MAWLYKISQAKPMALPFDVYPVDDDKLGLSEIDLSMIPETAEREKKLFNPSYLGAGNMGIAVELRDGRVGKYTNDKYEARKADRLKDLGLECIPEIYEVREVQKQDILKLKVLYPLWMIIMEKVKTLPQDAKKVINGISRDSYSKAEKEKEAKIARSPEHRKLIDDYIEMLQCLEMNGIGLRDAHGGNVGYNAQGRLVLFDLGEGF